MKKVALGALVGLVIAIGASVVAQQSGTGLPGGATNSTQFKLNGTSFGGAGPGTAGQVLTSRGVALSPTFQAAGGTPAGSTTQVQYNNSGAFGASSNLTFTSASSRLGLSGSGSTLPTLRFSNTGGTANNKLWDLFMNGSTFAITPVDDLGVFDITAMEIFRVGNTVDTITFNVNPGGEFGEVRITDNIFRWETDNTGGTNLQVANDSNGVSAVSDINVTNDIGRALSYAVTGSGYAGTFLPGGPSGANHAFLTSGANLDLTIGGGNVAALTVSTAGAMAGLTKLTTLASATGGAGLNVPAGTAPTSPVNGDVWTTTAGLFARINGATVGPFSASAGVSQTPGTWDPAFTDACATTPAAQTVAYVLTGSQVTLTWSQSFTCASDSANFSTAAGDVPAAIRPTRNVFLTGTRVVDNGLNDAGPGCIKIATDGTMSISRSVTSPCGTAAWTATGTKGYTGAASANSWSYTLN